MRGHRLTGPAILIALITLTLCAVHPVQALDRKVRLQVMKTVVQIGPVLERLDSAESTLIPIPWGSGTIISRDGLILTNQHVVDTSDLERDLPSGTKIVPDAFAIYLVSSSDHPPLLSYLATVVAQSQQRDLAVVKVDRNLKGQAIDTTRLNLLALGIGDSSQLEPGDNLYIFGFPGIGGDTITFTAGVVSGFTYQKNLGYRAWIKTDATIAGGNSGGTAVSDNGLLIGIPTEFGRGGLGGAVDYVDARPLADTNGDGVLDEKDIAVPMGGFINALRPTAIAQPVIEDAAGGKELFQVTPSKTVEVTGKLEDATSGQPVSGVLYALTPGTRSQDWIDKQYPDNLVYTYGLTDNQGNLRLPRPLERGSSYTLIAAADGYVPVIQEAMAVDEMTPAVVEVNLRMQKTNH
jgi:hypothetical protein